ncbi:lanthionine synthetase LanC family protein [Paraburkholderia sp. CI3]|uniref:lanthionine synthetase LanC family protein n=1 Tax=Paraburkholderia sp. CI3 TaxID=2991060 RepID=UPI003D263CC2
MSSDVANLLEQFRRPRTIVEAVINLTTGRPHEAEQLLELVLPTLSPFIKARWLVTADSEEAHRIAQGFSPGDVIEAFTVINCIQVLEDTEVYQVRACDGQVAALKIARPGASNHVATALEHEAEILRTLKMPAIPQVLAHGVFNGQAYLVLSWCAGIPVTQRAAEIRQLKGIAASEPLIRLCVNMLHVYGELHDCGVLHGDIYPKNVLASVNDEIFLVDHGQALRIGDSVGVPRGYVPQFCAPEHAQALLDARNKHQLDVACEQYSLGALCYLLITGQTYLNFSPVRNEIFLQIVNDPPLCLAEIGLPHQEDIQGVLHRALAKRAEERFPTVKAFGEALAAVARPATHPVTGRTQRQSHDRVDALLELLDSEDIADFPLPAALPSCSITFGAAGIAYALYQVACRRGEGRFLAAADAWAARAANSASDKNAFTHDVLHLPDALITPASLYYGYSGVPFVQALVANAMGDEAALLSAIDDFAASAREPCAIQDLTLGNAGTLVGCALLVDAIGSRILRENVGHPARQLFELAGGMLSRIMPDDMQGPLAPSGYLGVAHGGAGLCHAALLWSEVSGERLPGRFIAHLETLADTAEEHGRGLRWPVTKSTRESASEYAEGWCHGAPGYALMWTAAYRVLREKRYLALAERSAWAVWENSGRLGHLCCGDAGRAYALLSLFRHTGEGEWYKRAVHLAERSVAVCACDTEARFSLFKGELGATLLLEDLKVPEQAGFPLFERDMHAAG